MPDEVHCAAVCGVDGRLRNMGCAGSKPLEPAQSNMSRAMTRQMTVGEAMDHKLKHNETINELIEAAREELRGCKGK